MKKIPPYLREWEILKSRRGPYRRKKREDARRKQQSTQVNLNGADGSARGSTVYKNGVISHAGHRYDADAVPPYLDLEENFEVTVEFISEIRRRFDKSILRFRGRNRSKKDRSIFGSSYRTLRYYDFSKIQRISIDAALMIAAEYDRAVEITRIKPRAVNIEKWKPEVRELLSRIGFLELAGVDQQIVPYQVHGDEKILKMCRGTLVDGPRVESHLLHIGFDLAEEKTEFSEALIEAVSNCVDHAYKGIGTADGLVVKNWWLTGSLHEVDGNRKLVLIVYDRGQTIPKTLPNWKNYTIFRKAWSKAFGYQFDVENTADDGNAINAAIDVGRTSTGEDNRGKGLRQIVDALDACNGGSLTIISRCGVYSIKFKEKPEFLNKTQPLAGTLIKWELVL